MLLIGRYNLFYFYLRKDYNENLEKKKKFGRDLSKDSFMVFFELDLIFKI